MSYLAENLKHFMEGDQIVNSISLDAVKDNFTPPGSKSKKKKKSSECKSSNESALFNDPVWDKL